MFKFKLEFLQRYRRQKEDLAMLELAQRVRKLNEIESEVEDLHQRRSEIQAGLKNQFNAPIPATVFTLYQNHQEFLKKQGLNAERQLARAETLVERQRAKLVKCSVERKTIDRYKEKLKESHQQQEMIEEQKILTNWPVWLHRGNGMKNKDKKSRPGAISLETVIIIGLCLKLALTGGFLFLNLGDDMPFKAKPAFAQDKEKPKDEKAAAQPGEKPPAPANNAADTQKYKALVESLNAREEQLKLKEQRLNERETALGVLEKDLKERMDSIDATRQQLDALVKKHEELVEQQKILRDARIEHLVTAYKGMRAEQAGNLVNSLEDEVAVEILAAMPGRSAGQILAYVEPKKAARLTKAISERKPAETTAPPQGQGNPGGLPGNKTP